MKLGAALLGVTLFLGVNFSSSPAGAALTSSEKGQIKDFVGGARAENAHKVRSLVARTDLTPEESIAVLSEAVAPVAFHEQRGVFLKELAFGGASAPSRPVLVLAIVKALVARADAIFHRYLAGLDHEPRAVQELTELYGWLDMAIANAGKPTSAQHDGSAGIPMATYDDCAKVLREHIDQNARWLKGDGVVPDTVARLRAQAQMALIDMLPDGLTRRVDAADHLALKGSRRRMLTDWGVLFADAGKVDEPKVERVRQILERLPAARVDLALVYAGEDRGGSLRARGSVAHVASLPERYPFTDGASGSFDPVTSAIGHELAVIAAKRVLGDHSELRAQAERDAAASSGDPGRLLGRPRAPSVEHVVGAAMHALLTDAPRAIAVASTRVAEGRPESAALLSDALGVLAVSDAKDTKDTKDAKDAKGAKGAKTIELGKANAWVSATALRLAPNGVAIGFTVEGHAWAIDRAAPTYAVVATRRDGQPVLALPKRN